MMKSSPDSCRWLLVPGPLSWELWRVGDKGAHLAKTLSAAEASDWSAGGGAAVMPAVSGWVMVPMQVPGGEDDAEALREMAELRLEGDGILDGSELDDVDLFSVRKVGRGDAAIICSLTREGVDWVDGLAVKASRVVAPVEALTFEPNAITLRRELGSWVMVVTVDTMPVYYQRCGSGAFALANGARELSAVLMSLRMAGVDGVRFLETLVVEAEESEREEYDPEISPIARALGLQYKLTTERSIDPEISLAGLPRITTPGMSWESQRQTFRKRMMAIGFAASLIWLAVLGYQAYSVFALKSDVKESQEAAVQNEPEVKRLKEAERRIRELDFVMSERAFPLHVLLQVDALKSSATIRFKDFRVDSKRNLMIKGTAARPDDAIRFGENLRASRQFADYQWKTPNPSNTRDKTVTFSFTGTYTLPVSDAEPASQF